MSAKSDILAKINQKAQKIRDQRGKSDNPNRLEEYVFAFFKEAEQSRKILNGVRYEHVMLNYAFGILRNRLHTIDKDARAIIEFDGDGSQTDSEGNELFPYIRGVTIEWSEAYKKANNITESLFYIDVTDMLFA